MANLLKIQTNIKEIYMKLPGLNFSNEVIFSSLVPVGSLKRIVNKFKKSGIDMELVPVGDRNVIIKNGSVNFNTYLLKGRYL